MKRTLVRVVVVAAVALAVVALLFTVVFPWVDQILYADPVVR